MFGPNTEFPLEVQATVDPEHDFDETLQAALAAGLKEEFRLPPILFGGSVATRAVLEEVEKVKGIKYLDGMAEPQTKGNSE